MHHQSATGAVCGPVRSLLRAEGAAIFAAAIAGYLHLGASWKLFALLILAPDLSMLFYLSGPRVGAIAYNIMHTTIGPLALLGAGVASGAPLMIPIGLIWGAHIGVDRALGYGLKYSSAFGDTHLGRIGRARPALTS